MRSRTHRGRSTAFALVLLAVVFLFVYGALSLYLLNIATTAKRIPNETSPPAYGLPFSSIEFESAEDHIPLSGWIVPGTSDRAIVMIHGVDSNRSDGKTLEVVRAFFDRGYTVLLYDSRASGESGGTSIGLGWFERRDVRGAVDQLLMRGFRPGAIGIYGTSYGAATALLATAAIQEAGAVVADSAFADFRDLINSEQRRKTGLPPVFAPGMAFWFQVARGIDLEEITPIRAVPKIAPRPIFFIHGEADDRIPASNSVRLKAASTNPDDLLWIVPGAPHAEAYQAGPALYLSRVIGFYDRALR